MDRPNLLALSHHLQHRVACQCCHISPAALTWLVMSCYPFCSPFACSILVPCHLSSVYKNPCVWPCQRLGNGSPIPLLCLCVLLSNHLTTHNPSTPPLIFLVFVF